MNGPTALAASKEIIFQSLNWQDEEGWAKQMPIAQKALDSEDRREGLRPLPRSASPCGRAADRVGACSGQPLPEAIQRRLRLPLIAAPMLRVSGLELVIAACRSGVVGAFPTANAAPSRSSING